MTNDNASRSWKTTASSMAYDVSAMLRTAILACDPPSSPKEWNNDHGIERTLTVAHRLVGDLIDLIEKMEMQAKKVEDLNRVRT